MYAKYTFILFHLAAPSIPKFHPMEWNGSDLYFFVLIMDVVAPTEPDLYGNIPKSKNVGALTRRSTICLPKDVIRFPACIHSHRLLMRYSRLKTDDNNIELQHGFFQSVEQPTASSRGRSCRPSRRLSLGNHHPSWEDSMKPEDTTILMYQMLLQLPSLWYPVSRLMMIISNFQKLMRHPLPSFFHAEMMGDIMYYHQAMTQRMMPPSSLVLWLRK